MLTISRRISLRLEMSTPGNKSKIQPTVPHFRTLNKMLLKYICKLINISLHYLFIYNLNFCQSTRNYFHLLINNQIFSFPKLLCHKHKPFHLICSRVCYKWGAWADCTCCWGCFLFVVVNWRRGNGGTLDVNPAAGWLCNTHDKYAENMHFAPWSWGRFRHENNPPLDRGWAE